MGGLFSRPRLRGSAALILGIALAILTGFPGPLGSPVARVEGQQALAEYVLVPGDVVDIVVFGESSLTRAVTIRPDGKINIPLIGDIQAAGLTPSQLADRIATALKVYLRAPQVSVSVSTFQRAFAYVVGQVTRPGSVEIQRGWTVLEVMGVAGGVTPRAAMRRTTLIRRGTGQAITVDLDRLLLKGDRTVNASVEPGDIIMVPILQNRVLILGAVRAPGAHDLDDGARLLDALALAGGTMERAATHNIGVIRVGTDGKPAVTSVNLDKIIKGDVALNLVLQNADIVFIPPDNRITWREVMTYLTGLSLIRTLLGAP